MCRECFDSLSDRRSNERCEGGAKTAVSWVQPGSCWCSGISAVQSCREYRNGLL